ncbi:hypothetical protein R1sor_021240 [Riccia sorocarpa]|uniref:Meiosis-specific protein ASY3-like coiled-coil domain-containing protein n=1 Tax=Riccia sorocarpa TaxID=122646 RepID=A0ABD3GIL8_9MARC
MAAPKEKMQPGTPVRPDPSFPEDVKPDIAPQDFFQRVCQFLTQCERWKHLDCGKLKAIIKQLQKWPQSPMAAYLLDPQFLDILGRIFDRLAAADGKQEMQTLEELLGLLEDTNEFVQETTSEKTECGKHFIGRLLTLATSEVRFVSLHRAAVETLCAILTKSPANQQMVIDDRAACLKLFKQQLPNCGDFQLQAGITEVYYRLAKLDPRLLSLISEKPVRDAIEGLIQKPQLLTMSKIRDVVILLNQCMGPFRSVYSFPTNKILLNGKNVISSEENLISFGKRNFSFYQMDVDGDGPVVLDIEYESILELKSGDKSGLEMVVEDTHHSLFSEEYSAKAADVNKDNQVRILVSMDSNDFADLEATLLPKLLQLTSKKMGPANPPMRKSSIGIIAPQFKRPTLQPKNGAGSHPSEPVTSGSIPKKAPIIAPPSGTGDKTEAVAKESGSKLTLPPGRKKLNFGDELTIPQGRKSLNFSDELTIPQGRKKLNFSDEPVFVKATQVVDLTRHPSASPSRESLARTHAGKSTMEQRNRPEVQKEVTGEKDPDLGSKNPFSRTAKCADESSTDEKKEEYPTGKQKIGTLANKGRQILEDKSSNVKTFEKHNADGAECGGERRVGFAERDRKPLIINLDEDEDNTRVEGSVFHRRGNTKSTKELNNGQREDLQNGTMVGTRVETSEYKVYFKRGTSSARQGSVSKSATDLTDGKRRSEQKNGTKPAPLPDGRQEGNPALKRKGGPGYELEGAYSFETGGGAEKVVQKPKSAAAKANNKGNSNDQPEIAAHSDKGARRPQTARYNQVTRKYPTRLQAAKKRDSESSNSQTKSQSEGRSTSDDEWAPGKGNTCTDPIETDSQERKARTTTTTKTPRKRTAKGNLKQSLCGNLLRKSDLSIHLQTGKGAVPSSAKVQRKLTATGAGRKADDVHVFSFTSDDDDLIQKNLCNSLLRKRNTGGGKRLGAIAAKGRATTTLSFTTIAEKPGKVRVAAGIFDTNAQNKRTRVQKETERAPETPRAEPKDDDVLIMSKPPGRRHLQRKDEAQSHCKQAFWKSTSCTGRKVADLDLDVDAEDSLDLPSSDLSAGAKSPMIAGQDENAANNRDVDANNRGMQLITTMVKGFKDKVRVETERKMTDIVNQTRQLIQEEVEITQQQIEKDVAELTQIGKGKYAHLNNKLEGQANKMRLTYEQFQKDYNEQILEYEKIIDETETTDQELADMVRTKAQEHKELLHRLQEASMRRVAEADKKTLAVTKASQAMYGLKNALKGALLLEK